MKLRVKVDKSVDRAVKNLSNKIEKATLGSITEIAWLARSYAAELYEAAEYDGENDVKVEVEKGKGERSVSVVASGKSLPFIEYGTGLNQEYWYFSGEGKNVQLSSTGRLYKHRYINQRVKTESVTQYRVLGMYDKAGHDIFLQESQYKNVKRDKYGDYIMHPRLGRVALSAFQVEGDYTGKTERVKVGRTPVYNSEGNPPNDVMAQTREFIEEVAPEVIDRNIRRLRRNASGTTNKHYSDWSKTI